MDESDDEETVVVTTVPRRACKPRRALHSATFKLGVVRHALSFPEGARIKPVCRFYRDQGARIEPVQLRKWMRNVAHLERAHADAGATIVLRKASESPTSRASTASPSSSEDNALDCGCETIEGASQLLCLHQEAA